jgi:hypothetical protein
MPNPNPYSIEAQIISRLREQIPGLTIDAASALSGRVDPTAYCPGVYLKPGASTVKTSTNHKRLLEREQSWQFHILEINHNGIDSLAATRAGARISKILDAMLGWCPDGSRDHFQYESEDEPDYRDGYAIFALNLSKRQMIAAV